jgi:hypothetical protein
VGYIIDEEQKIAVVSRKEPPGLSYIEIQELSHLLLQRRSSIYPFIDTNWRESYYFNATDEKKQISLITTIGILPNRRRSSGFVIILKKGRIAFVKLLITKDIRWHETDNFCIRDLSYSLEGIDWRLNYTSKKCSFEVLFRPVNEYYYYVKKNDKKGANNFERLFSQHIEQAGLFEGEVFLNGDKLKFGPSPGHRDHSWGIRDWSSIDNYWLFSCTFGMKTAFNLWKGFARGNSFYAGYIFDSGKNLEINSPRIKEQSANNKKEPTGCEISFKDEKGKEHKIRCEVICSIPIPMPKCIIYETLAKMEYGDKVGFGLLERLVHDINPINKLKALTIIRKRMERERQ